MKNSIYCLLFLPLVIHAQKLDSIKVFYLGGQSNMDGYGQNSDLPDSLDKKFENAWIFNGNSVGDEKPNGGLGKWEQLKPGNGAVFSSNGKRNKHSKKFGLELTFASKLLELYKGEQIALIKYSKGGSSIDSFAAGKWGSWDPDYKGSNGINQYDSKKVGSPGAAPLILIR